MPPKRKAKADPAYDTTLDPSLVPPQDDTAQAAGSSKRGKTTGKAKTPAMSAERKEANRLAAERSRVRRATRASILEQTAKGLAEENLVLKERIKKLVAMGVSVEAERVIEEPKVADKEPSLGPISTPIASAPSVELPVPARTSKSSLHHEMETHFRNQIEELRHVLQEKQQQLASDDLPEMDDLSTQRHQIEFFNNRLLAEVRILHDAVVRVRAHQARAKMVTDRLRKRVREAEEQLLLKDGIADASFRVQERRSDVQRAFKDVKRHLGLLIGVSVPAFCPPCIDSRSTFILASSSRIFRSKRRSSFLHHTRALRYRNRKRGVDHRSPKRARNQSRVGNTRLALPATVSTTITPVKPAPVPHGRIAQRSGTNRARFDIA